MGASLHRKRKEKEKEENSAVFINDKKGSASMGPNYFVEMKGKKEGGEKDSHFNFFSITSGRKEKKKRGKEDG